MQQYHDLVRHVLDKGRMVQTRNGNRLTAYGWQMRFDLTEGFPAVTTKRLAFRQCMTELCWFLNGYTHLSWLHDRGCHIWDANVGLGDELWHGYGYQWRNRFGNDQIQKAIRVLKTDPTSTRNMVFAWNADDVASMSLPPCHDSFQLHSDGENLTLQFRQRSVDTMVGAPFNIASYSTLCHLFGVVSGLRPVEVVADLGNVHIYEQHIDNARLQVLRKPYPLPRLVIDGPISPNLRGLEPEQFALIDYQCHPAIKFELVA